MSEGLFGMLVVARLRASGLVEIESYEGLQLRLRVGGEQKNVSLERYYTQYRRNPAQVNIVVQSLVDVVTGAAKPAPVASDDFELVADRLMPLLMSSSEWADKRTAGRRLVVQPLLQDLGIVLVLQEEDSFRYVELPAIPAWGVDVADVFAAATRNLETQTQGVAFTSAGEGLQKILIDRSDIFAAARIILPSRLDQWAAHIEGDLVIGIPARDFAVGFSLRHPSFSELRAQVQDDARTSEKALLPSLLVYRSGVLQLLD